MTRLLQQLRPNPPIIIPGRATKLDLNKTLKNITDKFHVKYTKYNTNIYLHHKKDRDEMLRQLDTTDVKFFTYSDKTEKTYAFVIRGLDHDPTTDELRQDLLARNLTFNTIHKMRTNSLHDGPTRPLFMLVTSHP